MDELEALKQKKLRELMQRQQHQETRQQEQQQRLEQQIALLEQNARSVMTKDAISRLGNLKTAHPDIAVQAIVYVNELIQRKKITSIDDKEFKQLLKNLQTLSKPSNINITRK